MEKLYEIIECLYLEMKHLKEKPVRKNKTKVKKIFNKQKSLLLRL